ncbi:MAG: diaminopimelate epimerase [Corynebacterium sp.]|nr:diaminopimelate epimerase [Corynebacterium sp.]
MDFYKGHGTQNDFIIIPDADANIDLNQAFIAQLCDRQQGLGADGVLRVARSQALIAQGIIGDAGQAEYFMDYYNADGSIAEMCGNGTRVFAHWLVANNWVETSEFLVGTRAGDKAVTVNLHSYDAAEVSVEMGVVHTLGHSTASLGLEEFSGLGIDVGNPHLVVVNSAWSAEDIATLELDAPGFDQDFFPHGVNLEFATPIVDGAMTMRVFERGVGETRSCGTGTVATARAGLAHAGAEYGEVVVNIPGGQVTVTIGEEHAILRGPSRLVAQGVVSTQLA